jgi:two-component system response regulator HupR/HoxA
MIRRSQKLSNGAELAVEVTDEALTVADVDRALAAAALCLEAKPALDPAQGLEGKGGPSIRARALIGESPAMQELARMVERVRAANVTVLITGENGTGKELVARQIHTGSTRAHGPFVAINVGAFNDNLLESELFGHKKGAFTDAGADKAGLFQAAHGGTLFLDEVGEMSPSMQVKLLRVLEDGAVMPVGASAPAQVDVRIVAATNRDLTELVREGRFREDLFYRLNVVHIRVPSLRERAQDIPLLVRHFLAQIGARERTTRTFSAGALRELAGRTWPGNVRELENEVERLWVLSSDGGEIDETFVHQNLRKRTGGKGTSDAPSAEHIRTLTEAVEALERRMVVAALEDSAGNKTRAAEALGISRRNLIRKVQAFGLEPHAKSTVDGKETGE